VAEVGSRLQQQQSRYLVGQGGFDDHVHQPQTQVASTALSTQYDMVGFEPQNVMNFVAYCEFIQIKGFVELSRLGILGCGLVVEGNEWMNFTQNIRLQLVLTVAARNVSSPVEIYH